MAADRSSNGAAAGPGSGPQGEELTMVGSRVYWLQQLPSGAVLWVPSP